MAASAMTADGTARVLADENRIPLLGLGVWQIPDGPECVNAVRWALDLGYREPEAVSPPSRPTGVGSASSRTTGYGSSRQIYEQGVFRWHIC